MKPVVIFGAGATARLAYVYLSNDSPHEVVAFTAHEKYIGAGKLLGLDVVPFERLEQIYPPDQCAMFVTIGYEKVNKTRAKVYDESKNRGYELISYISSRAIHWGEIEVGDNCFIFENTVIQPFTKIGNDVIIGSGSHIGHDVTVGDHCYIAIEAAIPGHVKIGSYCFIGANATIRNAITIAPECIIGAGATILKDTRQGSVYVGKNTEAAPVTSSLLGDLQS